MSSSDLAAGRVLPVRAELSAVLPWSGLRRGGTVAVRGSTALLLALLAEATAAGSWAAVVGLPGLGVLAAAEAGVAVERLALVPRPGDEPAAVVAALLDGVDLVAVAGTDRIGRVGARKLAVRARQRGAVLVPFGSWPAADVELSCVAGQWHGLGAGHGYLRERQLLVRARGRGAAARPREAWLALPAAGGGVAERARRNRETRAPGPAITGVPIIEVRGAATPVAELPVRTERGSAGDRAWASRGRARPDGRAEPTDGVPGDVGTRSAGTVAPGRSALRAEELLPPDSGRAGPGWADEGSAEAG
ncbi:hypothetical protein GCM10012275_32710 [Longimycelium tulufanense]|uniref:Uncharacterized protein n=1 Tax=Longimycelium tulufanense TaxID=907463 RepID=A0A8J3CDN5_9PSEU|nr:hypothetical protein GCM10012275_32710 [Longimycelium tulufanense]